MKKWIIGLVVILATIFISAYVIFPQKINASNTAKFNCNIHSVNRFVMDEDKWVKWWPGKVLMDSLSNQRSYFYNGYEFKINGKQYNTLLIRMQGLDMSVDENLFFFKRGEDTVQAEWSYALATISNPVNKMYLYYQSKKINESLTDILKHLKLFLENQENVYGMRIHQEIVKDTILVTTNFKGSEYPSTREIYQHIEGAQHYISLHNAMQTGYPMLHVVYDSGRYKTQVAIPVNKEIQQNKTYLVRRMPPLKILVGQVRGGAYKANDALRQLGIYMTDNHLSAPAIPFESLITNRMEEPDSNKWITKIYYPVY